MKKIISMISAIVVCLALAGCKKSQTSFDKFENLELVRTGFVDRIVYYDLESLETASDIAVIGKFIGETEQKEEYHYSEFFGKDILHWVSSTNTIEVKKVLMGDVNVGDKLKVTQWYGIVDDKLITFSNLTPIQKGDEWVFFLELEPTIDNCYWCTGDSDGRYPVSNSSNNPMPLSECPELGVYDEMDFKNEIYSEILERYDI
ncbi:MAG: hypothetical protein K2N06_04905 [Oscillospiraceae bacterium]|nr:hypothetical protein [Oscillospiraceae bacterium]